MVFNRVRIWESLILGFACLMSAIAAATCGVACEVPDLVPY